MKSALLRVGKTPLAHKTENAFWAVSAAVLSNQGQELLHQRGEVERLRPWGLEPFGDQQPNLRDVLDQAFAQAVGRRGVLVDWVLKAVAGKDGRLAFAASGTAKPLAKAGHRGRGADLRDAPDGAKVDAELKGGGCDCSCRSVTCLEGLFGLLPNFLGQAAVMRPELVRYAAAVAGPAQ